MTSITSQLSIYNASLRIIKQVRLASLTEDVDARYHLDDEYEKVRLWALEQGLWNFASRTVEIQDSDDEVPLFGKTFAFDKPSDFVRLVSISYNDDMWPELEDDDYEDEGDYWFCYSSPIYVQYVSNDTSYGLDLAKWPSSYELFVEHELAYRIAPHLTSLSNAELQDLERQRDRAMKDARSKDAMNQGAKRHPPGRLTRARSHGRATSGRPWWR